MGILVFYFYFYFLGAQVLFLVAKYYPLYISVIPTKEKTDYWLLKFEWAFYISFVCGGCKRFLQRYLKTDYWNLSELFISHLSADATTQVIFETWFQNILRVANFSTEMGKNLSFFHYFIFFQFLSCIICKRSCYHFSSKICNY